MLGLGLKALLSRRYVVSGRRPARAQGS